MAKEFTCPLLGTAVGASTSSRVKLITWSDSNILVKPSASNYLGDQYRSPEVSKIVDFQLTLSMVCSSSEINHQQLKDIIRENLKINELCNLIKVDTFTWVES